VVLVAVTLAAAACAASDQGGGDHAAATSTSSGAAPATLASVTTAPAPLSATLNGSGSTFALPFYQEAIAQFRKEPGNVRVSYAGGGSGKGRQDLADQVVDWAGTDAPIKAADKGRYRGGDVLYFPTVAAPITISYHLSGARDLRLAPATIASIFERRITRWDDPAIGADNPGATLPGKAITVVHRADGSGTTEQFSGFLQAAVPDEWHLGSGSTLDWPADTQAGNGNGGVTSVIRGTDGAIGYVDYSDARAAGLAVAAVKNKAGRYVEPGLAGTVAALAGAQLQDDLTYRSVWADGDDAYPIASPTWLITYKDQTDKEKGLAMRSWLEFLYGPGQQLAPELDYAALPDAFVARARAQIDQLVIPS
jgi:phosphate transport system substrate-binding protein